MAYYDAFIAAWNAGGKPVGTSGTDIIGGMTAAQKLAAVNGWTIAGPTSPMVVATYKIYNAIDPTEFLSLSAALQTRVRDIWTMGTVDASPGTNANATLTSAFAGKPTTLAALQTLANTFKTTIPWWQANGYPRPFDNGDQTAAGVS